MTGRKKRESWRDLYHEDVAVGRPIAHGLYGLLLRRAKTA